MTFTASHTARLVQATPRLRQLVKHADPVLVVGRKDFLKEVEAFFYRQRTGMLVELEEALLGIGGNVAAALLTEVWRLVARRFRELYNRCSAGPEVGELRVMTESGVWAV